MVEGSDGRRDNIRIAVLSIVFAVSALSFGDAVIKGLSVSFSLWQIYVVRSLIAATILLAVIRLRDPKLDLVPKSLTWTSIRSGLLACMWIAYYAALPHIKLSVAAAVYYTIPLFITLFSAYLTGDRVRGVSWFAVVLGFAGVIIIVRPDMHGFNAYVLLPLVAAILYALAMILTRTKCMDEDPKVLALSLNVMFILVGAAASLVLVLWTPDKVLVDGNRFLLGGWTELNNERWLALMVLGVIVVVGSFFSAVAYQSGPAPTVASFDYSYLVFSALWGLLFFSESPDGLTLLGMAMIAGAGLIAVRA